MGKKGVGNLDYGVILHLPFKTDKLMLSKIEVNITQRCNINCYNCDRACRWAPDLNDMSMQQVETFVTDSIDMEWQWKQIAIIGGEPTLHKNLLDICNIINAYKNFNPSCKIQLKTNGSKPLDAIPKWIELCIDKKTSANVPHVPFTKSPLDTGKFDPNQIHPCQIYYRCGMSLTTQGYAPCSPGATVNRIFNLGMNIPRLKDVTFEKLASRFPLLCQHCGHYCGDLSSNPNENRSINAVITNSWKKAINNYNSKNSIDFCY